MNEETHPWILQIISHSKGDNGYWMNYNHFCLCPLGESELLEGKIGSHSCFWISGIPLLLLNLLCTSSVCWKQITLELRCLKSFLWVRNWRVILLFLAQGLSIIFKILARDAVIWRLGWAGGSTPKMTHTYSWQVGGGCWQETQLSFMQASPQGCLSILIIWIPHEWWKERKEEEQYHLCLNLGTHTPWFPLYPINFIC